MPLRRSVPPTSGAAGQGSRLPEGSPISVATSTSPGGTVVPGARHSRAIDRLMATSPRCRRHPRPSLSTAIRAPRRRGAARRSWHVIRNAGGVITDDEVRASIQQETGIKPAWAAEAFGDLDEDVRQPVARIKASPFIPHKDSVRGFVFDVGTGLLREVS